MARFSWTQPACEACYVDHYPRRNPPRLVESMRAVERCVWCEAETRDGIYVRIDPAWAPHPTRER